MSTVPTVVTIELNELKVLQISWQNVCLFLAEKPRCAGHPPLWVTKRPLLDVHRVNPKAAATFYAWGGYCESWKRKKGKKEKYTCSEKVARGFATEWRRGVTQRVYIVQ